MVTRGLETLMKVVSRLWTLLQVALATAIAAAPLASAQAAADAPANEGSDTEIVVEAFRRDRALDAFLRGDFAAAEAGFQENWKCIWRNQRLFEAGVRQAILDATTGSQGTGRTYMSQQSYLSMARNPDEIRERTCFNAEWQFYMMGLSQIQLGKFAEAKKSLSRAAEATSEELMFDAHYRLGLLEVLDGNIENADRRLSYLSKLQRRCKNRGLRCELHEELDEATAYLRHAIVNARRGSAG
jgi:tetratricopeptide (TPR) repeat protein